MGHRNNINKTHVKNIIKIVLADKVKKQKRKTKRKAQKRAMEAQDGYNQRLKEELERQRTLLGLNSIAGSNLMSKINKAQPTPTPPPTIVNNILGGESNTATNSRKLQEKAEETVAKASPKKEVVSETLEEAPTMGATNTEEMLGGLKTPYQPRRKRGVGRKDGRPPMVRFSNEKLAEEIANQGEKYIADIAGVLELPTLRRVAEQLLGYSTVEAKIFDRIQILTSLASKYGTSYGNLEGGYGEGEGEGEGGGLSMGGEGGAEGDKTNLGFNLGGDY